jgi:hypothetical protein
VDWELLMADGRRYLRPNVETALDRFGQYGRSAIYSAVMGLAISLVTTEYSIASEEAD